MLWNFFFYFPTSSLPDPTPILVPITWYLQIKHLCAQTAVSLVSMRVCSCMCVARTSIVLLVIWWGNSGHSCGAAVSGCHVFYCLRDITQPKKATSGSSRQKGLALHPLPIISLFCKRNPDKGKTACSLPPNYTLFRSSAFHRELQRYNGVPIRLRTIHGMLNETRNVPLGSADFPCPCGSEMLYVCVIWRRQTLTRVWIYSKCLRKILMNVYVWLERLVMSDEVKGKCRDKQ